MGAFLQNLKMHNILKNHIVQRSGKEPDKVDYVLTFFEAIKAKRGTHLLQQGEICKYVYFIVEGCLQVYVTDINGNETTREFYFENGWTTDIFGFQNQFPSTEFIRCVEHCKLLRIHHKDFVHLSEVIPQFSAIYKQILEVSYNNTVYRVNTLMSLDALGRIKWLMENQPKILTRLSSKLLASYLGITSETMTRLKSKL